MAAHDGRHGEGCFGCKIRTIQFSPAAMPSRRNKIPPRTPNNSWEKGIATDGRGVPILRPDMEPMGLKEASEKRHVIADSKRQAHNAPALPTTT